jgi:hypothetical protein
MALDSNFASPVIGHHSDRPALTLSCPDALLLGQERVPPTPAAASKRPLPNKKEATQELLVTGPRFIDLPGFRPTTRLSALCSRPTPPHETQGKLAHPTSRVVLGPAWLDGLPVDRMACGARGDVSDEQWCEQPRRQ